MLLFGLILVVVFACLLAAPLTFFTMLFLGNLGVHLGFMELLPGAIALRIATTSMVNAAKES